MKSHLYRILLWGLFIWGGSAVIVYLHGYVLRLLRIYVNIYIYLPSIVFLLTLVSMYNSIKTIKDDFLKKGILWGLIWFIQSILLFFITVPIIWGEYYRTHFVVGELYSAYLFILIASLSMGYLLDKISEINEYYDNSTKIIWKRIKYGLTLILFIVTFFPVYSIILIDFSEFIESKLEFSVLAVAIITSMVSVKYFLSLNNKYKTEGIKIALIWTLLYIIIYSIPVIIILKSVPHAFSFMILKPGLLIPVITVGLGIFLEKYCACVVKTPHMAESVLGTKI